MNASFDIASTFAQAIANSDGEGPKDDKGAALDVVVPLDHDYAVGLSRNTVRAAWMLWVERDLGYMSEDDRERHLDTLLEVTAVSRTGSGQMAGLTPEGRLAIYARLSHTSTANQIDKVIGTNLKLLTDVTISAGPRPIAPIENDTIFLKL